MPDHDGGQSGLLLKTFVDACRPCADLPGQHILERHGLCRHALGRPILVFHHFDLLTVNFNFAQCTAVLVGN